MSTSPNAAEASRRIAPETDAGYAALTHGAGVRSCPDRVVVRMTGDDRVSFLQGMCSNDIQRLEPGGLVPALFLTERAHLIADAVVWAAPDALLMELDRALWPAAREQLDRFLVADDVEMEELAGKAVMRIDGPLGAELAGTVFGEPAASLATWRHIEAPGGARVASVTRWGARAFTVIADSTAAPGVIARLIAAGTGRQVHEAAAEACEIVRVESGTARVGVDTDARTLAMEARMERAISFDKGCYVGQETVERATARGGLKRRLMGLRIGGASGGRIPGISAQVMLDGKEVGHLTSPVHSPRIGTIGLAILHHGAWTAGTAVVVRDANCEVSAAVSELPFAAD